MELVTALTGPSAKSDLVSNSPLAWAIKTATSSSFVSTKVTRSSARSTAWNNDLTKSASESLPAKSVMFSVVTLDASAEINLAL